MPQQKVLKANRRDLLRDYILACLRDNVLSWTDLASGEVIEKLVRAASSDVREVVAELLRTGATNAIGMLGNLLASRAKR